MHGGEVERLADVALAGGAVAEVGHGADLGPVPLGPDGVADRVQGLGADGDRVLGDLVALGIPAGQGGPAEQAEDRQHLHAGPDVDDTVLAVGGEDEVVRPERPGAADLSRLLAEAGRPRCRAGPGAGGCCPRRRCAAPPRAGGTGHGGRRRSGRPCRSRAGGASRPRRAAEPARRSGPCQCLPRRCADLLILLVRRRARAQTPGTVECRSGGSISPRNRRAQVRRFQYTRAGTNGPGPCGCRPGGGASGSPGDRSRSVAADDDSVNVLRCSQTEHQGNYGDGHSGSCTADYPKSARVWSELTIRKGRPAIPHWAFETPQKVVHREGPVVPRPEEGCQWRYHRTRKWSRSQRQAAPSASPTWTRGQARLPGDGAVRGVPRL